MDNELAHYGILGMKWGVRRYQNKDGTRTAAGKKRYSVGDSIKGKVKERAEGRANENKHRLRMELDPIYRHKQKEQPWNEKPSNKKPWDEKPGDRNKYLTSTNVKRGIAVGAAATATLLATYGAYRCTKYLKGKNAGQTIGKGKEFYDACVRTFAGKKGKQSKPAHEDYSKAHDKKSVKDMSDAELRERLVRLNMEQQYGKLTKSDTGKGKSFVSKAIKAATTVATVTTTAITIHNNYEKIAKIIKDKQSKINKKRESSTEKSASDPDKKRNLDENER